MDKSYTLEDVVRERFEATKQRGKYLAYIVRGLDAAGIRFWRDIHDASSGPLDKIVDAAMRQNPIVVLVLSKVSVNSDWVENEADLARKLEKELSRHILCPVALDDSWKGCEWSRRLRKQVEKYNILPFHKWENPDEFEGMFRRLIKGLDLFYKGSKE